MIENEILTAENVEVDMQTLNEAMSHRVNSLTMDIARVRIVEAVIYGLYPDDRAKLELYKNQ